MRNVFAVRSLLLVKLLLLSLFILEGQAVYKTPSGKKYHRASCQRVKNVSEKLESASDIRRHGLTPCKICEPPIIVEIQYGLIAEDKSVGESTTTQCRGMTQKGNRCQHRTKLADGYCYQHTAQTDPDYAPAIIPASHPCGARTQSGSACKRSVREGVHYYQHGGG